MLSLAAKKIGMSRIYKEDGTVVPFTLVKLYDNCVVDFSNNGDSSEFNSLLLGFDKVENPNRVSKPISGVFNKKKLALHRKIYGCKVSKKTSLKVGDVIDAKSILSQGDVVSISGISVGKGFAGGMKRHGFGGLEATHGISISHRSHGSTGQCQDPGKVFKGKKMAGHMGVDKVTIKNLTVLMVNDKDNVVAIKGSVPGKKGGDLFIKVDKDVVLSSNKLNNSDISDEDNSVEKNQ